MAFNGSGTFARLFSFVTDRNNGVKVRADRMDDELNGFATGLSNCITRDGQSNPSADIPWNNKKLTGLGDASAGSHALNRQTADARYVQNAADLTQETALADDDEVPFYDTSASANRSSTYANLKSKMVLASRLVGEVADYAGTSAPSLWLLCYGQAVSRTTYAALYAVVGTTFGVGDGSTTFNLPDLRGRVVAGQDDMGGSSANRLTGLTNGINGDTFGLAGGLESTIMARANLPNDTVTTNTTGAHTHSYSDDGITGGNDVASGGSYDENSVSRTTGSAGNHSHTFELNGGVTQTAMNNVQPTLILNKIIFAGV